MEVGPRVAPLGGEREVAVLLARGASDPEIADLLFVSRGTVKRHIENILSKLALGSRSQVAVWAAQSGLLDDAPVA
jgi:DNA-binding NarL/FixJ family response regulator